MASSASATQTTAETPEERPIKRPRLVLADAPEAERDVIERLRHSASWVRRSFAAQRLARFDCDGSEVYLRDLLADESWRVRSFAILSLARRGLAISERTFENESEIRVIRTALRCFVPVPAKPLEQLVRRLAKSESLEDKTLALELALAADYPGRAIDVGVKLDELLTQIVMRMDRVETGSLSPRLAAITRAPDSGRNYRWREWFRKNRKNLGLHGGYVVALSKEERSRGPVAEMPTARLVELERHMQDLSEKPIELAIALDCTASMSGEIAECQSGIDSLMLFAQDVGRSARIGIVGYRDQQANWETRGWDLTSSLAEAREHLWELSAEGGGDRPESVLPALKLAFTKMSWSEAALKSVIVVGDAPPHPGTGEQCVALAAKGRQIGIRTFTIAPRAPDPRAPTAPRPDRSPQPARGEPDAPTSEPPRSPASAPSDPSPPVAPRPTDDDQTPRGPMPWTPPKKTKEKSPWLQKLKPGEVEYWKEIAEAGGGRTVGLPDEASLMAEIAGLTLGDAFQEEFESFFASWMALCR